MQKTLDMKTRIAMLILNAIAMFRFYQLQPEDALSFFDALVFLTLAYNITLWIYFVIEGYEDG